MLIYSKTIIQFIHEIKSIVKQVLSQEIGLKVHGDRFYNKLETSSYPLKIVIFNTKSMLGYFDSEFYELGFNECLLRMSRTHLHNVIRHELAHYITFMNYGGRVLPHGDEFKAFCKHMKWNEEVALATVCLEGDTAAIEESSVFRKVQKLLALASSSNKNEAELAMIKSQQLLLTHNVESIYFGSEIEEKTYLKRIMKQKKVNAKMRAIANILATFFVNTVFSQSEEGVYLEICGDAVNIEIAEYVAAVLHSEFDTLWSHAQKETQLRGIVAKNSFFLGIARGYCDKINALQRDYTIEVKNGLMVIEKKLVDAQALVYPRLSRGRSTASYCHESGTLGEQVGRQLNINPAVNASKKDSQLYITRST